MPNWPDIANYFLHRMRESLRVRGSGSPLRPVYDRAMAQPGVREIRDGLRRSSGTAVVPVVLVEELTIEQFYPAQS